MMFNDALSTAAEIVLQHLGDPNRPVILVRDLFGKFRVVLPDDRGGVADGLATALTDALGVYGYAPTSTFLRESDIGTVASSARVIRESAGGARVVLVDRLLMGTEWSDPPADLTTVPKRFTLFSMKGGVGRSTTAAVLAHHLASRGKKIAKARQNQQGVVHMLKDKTHYDYVESLVGGKAFEPGFNNHGAAVRVFFTESVNHGGRTFQHYVACELS